MYYKYRIVNNVMKYTKSVTVLIITNHNVIYQNIIDFFRATNNIVCNIVWNKFAGFNFYIFRRAKSTRFVNNSCLNDATDFIFAQQPNNIKRNGSWNFDQILIRWRHFMRSYIPPLPMGGVLYRNFRWTVRAHARPRCDFFYCLNFHKR